MTLYPHKGIVFDAGPIISMTLSGLLPFIEELQGVYPGKFVIPKGVKDEVITKPLSTKKYKFESIQIMPLLAKGIIEEIDSPEITAKANDILALANTIYFARGQAVKIVHLGEAQAIAVCLIHQMKTLVIDERTTRYLIEFPERIKKRLERKLHTKVTVDRKKLASLNKQIKDIRAIRSTELIAIAFKKGFFKEYEYANILKKKNFKGEILEGILWALKLNGCAILEEEIKEIQKIASK